MTLSNDRVKYQLEKASAALREAVKYGAAELSPYQLGNIVDALKELDSAEFSLGVMPSTLKVNDEDPAWEELKQRTIGMPGFKFNADVEFVSAVSE